MNCEFVRTHIYDIDPIYFNRFDLVYTTVGALCWFDDLERFFAIAAQILRANGHLFVYETHPVLDLFALPGEEDYDREQELKIAYSYFRSDPFINTNGLDYVGNTQYAAKTAYTFLAYRWRELNRLDYSIDDCQSFHRAIEQTVVPLLAQMRANNTRRPTVPEIADPALLSAGVERMLNHVDPAFGTLFAAMRPDYLDFGSRPGKAVTSEQWFFPGAGMPYLHVASTDLGTVLHESGHAAHVYLSFQSQGSMWNLSGPEEFEEFAAVSMEMLGWPYYAQAEGGLYSATESRVARESVLQLYLDVLASCVMRDAFEHWVYSETPETVTPADLDAKWLELKARFMPWELDATSAEEAMTGWQRWNWSLFRMPLYMITYPFATIGSCQLGRLAETDRKGVVQRYKAALVLGNTQSLPELFRVAGLTFPFTQPAVAEAVQFVTDHLKDLARKN